MSALPPSQQPPSERRGWGDDDDDERETELAAAAAEAAAEAAASVHVESPTTTKTPPAIHRPFRIRYTRHTTTYGKTLYDVDGRPILDEHGNRLNLWTPALKDYLAKGQVKCIHVCMQRPGYRFFVVNEQQRQEFVDSRDRGWMPYDTPYHIYEDEPGVMLPYE